MVAIKSPCVIDISHHIPVADFRALDPLPWLILTKATEDTWYRDPTYPAYARGIRSAGIRLGAYHFARRGNEIAQADWFCRYLLEVGLQGNEILAYDMEVSGITLDQIHRFLDRVQLVTGIRPLIYSSQLLLENLYKEKPPPAWLTQEWLWIAEYPMFTELPNDIPSWIVPRGCSREKIALWQYSDDGILGGIPGNNVDLNLINPTFVEAIGLTEPKEVSMPYVFSITPTGSAGSKVRPEPDTGNVPLPTSLPYGKFAYGNKRLTIAEDKFEGSVQVNKAGDIWLEVVEVNGVVLPSPSYVAEIHLGQRYARITQINPVPDPSGLPDLPVTITLGDDITYAKQTISVTLKPKST
jgi:GH25 family lysozyme M1 (1,4-beta-N-acetylmuramidase)